MSINNMKVVTIDTAGDLYLEMNSYDLLVSSRVMSLASPVFAAMLSPNFKEGQSDGQGIVKRIRLPEDDEEALSVICYTLHHCTENIPQRLEASLLAKIAILCDKYCCVNVFKPWAMIWLPATTYIKSQGLEYLLLAAYLLDLPETFNLVSWAIILKQKDPFLQLPGTSNPTLMPSNVLGDLEARTVELKLNLGMIITASTLQITDEECCNSRSIFAAQYNRRLALHSGLSQQPCTYSILSCLEAMPKMTVPYYEACEDECEDCDAFSEDHVTETLRNAKKKFLDKQMGICLDCVKTGRQSRFDKRCRHDHSTPMISV